MSKLTANLKEFTIITVAAAIVAASVFFFLVPSTVAVGSISALSVVLANFLPLPVSWINMIINVGLLIVGFIFIGREFGIKTVYTSILIPALLAVFETIFPDNASLTADPFLDMLCYVFASNVGISILFLHNASSGGLDIVAKFLHKFLHMDLGNAMAVAGMCVAVSPIFTQDIKIVILSVMGTYINGIVLDYYLFGSDGKKRVCIISKKLEEIRQFILQDLHSGATIYEARGAYNKEPYDEIITIVDKNEYMKLMTFIEKTDPDAFVTIYTVHKVIYRPKN